MFMGNLHIYLTLLHTNLLRQVAPRLSYIKEMYAVIVLKINSKKKKKELALTFAFSMTFANSPTHKKQRCGVNNRKQSPLFSDEALGSTNLV